MYALQRSRRLFLSVSMIISVVFAAGCDLNTNEPIPDPSSQNVGGKVTSFTKTGDILTFSPAAEFYSARFYAGNVLFADINGSKWRDRAMIDQLADNTTMNDGTNDWQSPFNLSTVSALESGKTYTMLLFFTANKDDASQQGRIVFTR